MSRTIKDEYKIWRERKGYLSMEDNKMTNEEAFKIGYDFGQIDRDKGEDDAGAAWRELNQAMAEGGGDDGSMVSCPP